MWCNYLYNKMLIDRRKLTPAPERNQKIMNEQNSLRKSGVEPLKYNNYNLIYKETKKMSEKVSITKSKLDSLANAIAAVGETSVPKTIAQMESAVLELTIPPNLQSKTITPSVTQQIVSPDSGYDAFSQVTVNAMPSGTAGTPTATKGTVSNNSISVTPSVTNTTGYITGGTLTGTAVTVSASELVSGTKEITVSGTTNVTNYASASVATGTVSPRASKGIVSGHAIKITPYADTTSGFINTGAYSGTRVTVDVTELESGTKTITENGTGISVSGYSTVDVNVASAQKGAKLWVDVQDGETVSLNIYGNTSVADWGDGESGGTSHTYKYGGLKVITVVGSLGAYALRQSSSSHNMNLLAVEYFAISTVFSSMFAFCDKLESLSITADAGALRSLDTQMFGNNTNLKYLHLAEGMPVISATMFYGCSSLTTVTIPSTITTIGSNAFSACTSLSVVHVLPTVPPSLGSAYVFSNNATNRIIYVPYSDDHSIITAYQSATNWSNYASAMQEEPQ